MREQRRVTPFPHCAVTLGLVALGLCASCAGTLTTRPIFKFDKYAGEYTLNGARFEINNAFVSALKQAESTAWLRGIYKPKTSTTGFRLVVRHQRDAVRFFGFVQASDSDGNPLPVEEEKQGTSGKIAGGFRGDEVVTVELTRQYLVDKSTTGIDIRLLNSDKEDALIVTVPPKYIADFLQLFDESLAQVAGPVPASTPEADVAQAHARDEPGIAGKLSTCKLVAANGARQCTEFTCTNCGANTIKLAATVCERSGGWSDAKPCPTKDLSGICSMPGDSRGLGQRVFYYTPVTPANVKSSCAGAGHVYSRR